MNSIHTRLRDNPFYRYLYQMVYATQVQNILEVGSGDGTGSTQIILEALKARELSGRLFCLEPHPEKFQRLQQALDSYPNAWAYSELSVYPCEYPSIEDIQAFRKAHTTVLNLYSEAKVLKWRAAEEAFYRAYPHPQHGIQLIMAEHEIQAWDLVVLDGGEFSGPADLDAVYGAQVLILDDANSYKNHEAYQRLKADPDYYLIQENLKWTHGVAVFQRRPTYQPGLSVIVHTLNAEKKLAQCLDSVRWANECLVIDMYSQDKTLEIAESFGARILSHVPVPCVDEARNFGLAQAQFAWTLVLDADEFISAELAGLIQNIVQDPKAEAYWLPRQNYFFKSWVSHLFPDYQLRLFKSCQVSWSGRVHEHARALGSEAYLAPELENAIQHESYDTVSDFTQRQNIYAQTYVEQAQLEGQRLENINSIELRTQYETRLQTFLDRLQSENFNNHEWLVRSLYQYSDLLNLGYLLEASGQLQGHTQAYRLSAYSYIKNGEKFDYPYLESILSALPICDEFIICVAADSEDNTEQKLKALAEIHDKIKIYRSHIWERHSHQGGELIRRAAEEAQSYCSGDWLWHIQSDEVYSKKDVQKIKRLLNTFHKKDVHGFLFKVIHFYEHYQQVIKEEAQEIGWYPWCVRLVRQGKGTHLGDAWTQQVEGQELGSVLNTQISIYHYGHVRAPEAMRIKSSYMERLYHDLPENYEVAPPGEFQYSKVPATYLSSFQGSHPEAMRLRMAKSQLRIRSEKPRILVVSRNPHVKKGYGITFNAIYSTQILQRYFEVHHLAWHYHHKAKEWQGVILHPDSKEKALDPRRLRELLYQLQPQVVLIHADAHFFTSYLKELEQWTGPVLGWFTVDYFRTTNPPNLRRVYQHCQGLATMAQFSIEQIQKDVQVPVAKIPLGVDTSRFKPCKEEEKLRLRHKLGFAPETFVFLVVANNFWRKGIEYAIYTFYRFLLRYPAQREKSLLYLHTEVSDPILELIASLGLQDHICMSRNFDPFKNPLSTDELIELYQMADAFLLTTLGEGFGMPILEAQACGLPIIVSDNTVIREISGNHGYYIRCNGKVSGNNGGHIVWMEVPDPDHGASLMNRVSLDHKERISKIKKGFAHARMMTWTQTSYLLAEQIHRLLPERPAEFAPHYPEIIQV